MEQQQCPICMLYLLPGMCLQDHLDTHPKDMIIKALLSVKTEQPKQPTQQQQQQLTPPVSNSNELTATTVFLTTPYNSSQNVYQPHQQQQQQQPTTGSFAVAKRNSGNNPLILGNRPYRLTLDTSQQAAVSSPTTATFLNASAVAPSNSYGRRMTNESDLFSDNNKTAFRCIQQNTEQKNIMIVNTSSTQFSIQQTVPVKKPQTAIELHPVIIDNSAINPLVQTSNAISIIPRYTSEKYSGPPPSYESSVTNTINDKQSRVIDLTQTPTTTAMKMMEKQQCIQVGNSNNKNCNGNNKLTTLNSNGADENRHLMITPQKVLEYTQSDDGEFMIVTEKVLSHLHQHPTTSLNVSHDEQIVEENHETDDHNNGYNSLKYVEINEPLTFNLTSSGDHNNRKFQEEESYTVIEESEVEPCTSFSESQGSCSNAESHAPKKSGVKVISNVKLTTAELSPTIKDIIKQYNNNASSTSKSKNNNNNCNKPQTEKETHVEQPVVDIIHTEILDTEDEYDDEGAEKNDTKALIQCTETLNLSSGSNSNKEIKEEASSSSSGGAYATSVIRKTTTSCVIPSTSKAESNLFPGDVKELKVKSEPEPSTSAECLKKATNVVFNSANRLKQKEIYKQPKKLVVKLKKPLLETSPAIVSECPIMTSSGNSNTKDVSSTGNEFTQIKNENEERETITTSQLHDHDDENVDTQKHSAMTERDSTVFKVERNEEFTVTFLDQHDYESINVTPEIHHDSETNQSVMSMELEPETSIVKREQTDSDLPIIVKTEVSSCSISSMVSNSQNESSRSPSRINLENTSININGSSPINFLYQNDRVRFSPPLSPYVYMKTFSTGDDQPKQETDGSWNSSSVVTQNSDQNSTCSRYTPSFDDNRSNYTDMDVHVKSRNEVHIRAPSTDSLNIRTDEKMPARGEISEQESNGEIEQPWHPVILIFL